MIKATSSTGEINLADLQKVALNVVLFDLPAYVLTMTNIRLSGGSWERALLEPLPVFCLAFIDLVQKYIKQN